MPAPARHNHAVTRRFLIVNILLFGLLLWALDDPTVVRIDVDDMATVATVEGTSVAVEPIGTRDGGIGLYLDGQVRSPLDPTWKRVVLTLAWPLFQLDADPGWQSVRMSNPEGAVVFEHDFRRDGFSHWRDADGAWVHGPTGDVTTGFTAFLAGGALHWPGGRIEATLQRGRNAAGIAVAGDGTGTGLLFLVRPVHRDMLFWRLRDGVWTGPAGGGPYQRPWYSAVKDLLRLLLRPYFLALFIAAAALAAGLAWRAAAAAIRWLRTPARQAAEPEAEMAGERAGSADGREWNGLPWMAAAALSAIVVAATGTIADLLLERLPHVQDSVGYLFQAKLSAGGALWSPLPTYPEFFEHEFVVMNDDRWFAKYPPGFPALLALGVVMGAHWIVNPLAAGCSVLALYVLGARTVSRGVGLLAALLLALSPFFLFLSGELMAHTTGLLFALLFALCYVEMNRGSRVAALLAGLALGIDFLIRPWTAIAIAAPFGIDLVARLIRTPKDTLVKSTYMAMALGLAPMLALFALYSWLMTGSPTHSTMELWWSFDRLGFGSDRGIFGHSPFNGLLNTLRNLNELSLSAFGWPPLFTFTLAFLPFVTRLGNRWDRLWLAAWFSLMLGYLFWWADGVMYGPRFYHEALGFLCLLTARGAALIGRLGALPGRIAAAALLCTLVAVNLALYLPTHVPGLRGYNYVSRARLDVVERAGVRDAIVFVDPGGQYEWWNYGMLFSANSPWLDTSVLYARDLGPFNERLMREHPSRRFYRLGPLGLEEMR